MAPMFSVEKKDNKKRIVQNYRYLNKQTIKTNYPLPLISDIIENISTKKMLDLRWEYNNIWIKQEDKWKTAFIMLKRLFEPTIIFFGLTNSPVIFQTMINKILQDLINTK